MWQFDDLKQDASDGSHYNESDLENSKRSSNCTFLILEFQEKNGILTEQVICISYALNVS